jgi:hypothetical protein
VSVENGGEELAFRCRLTLEVKRWNLGVWANGSTLKKAALDVIDSRGRNLRLRGPLR